MPLFGPCVHVEWTMLSIEIQANYVVGIQFNSWGCFHVNQKQV